VLSTTQDELQGLEAVAAAAVAGGCFCAHAQRSVAAADGGAARPSCSEARLAAALRWLAANAAPQPALRVGRALNPAAGIACCRRHNTAVQLCSFLAPTAAVGGTVCVAG
jgi:hypothetical protein